MKSRCLSAALLFAASSLYAADVAVFNFDNAANPVENTGLGPDGVLLGGATVSGGELVIDGLDQALDIPLGAINPFGGDGDWRVEFDFRTEGEVTTGVLFSSDSAECADACNDGEQAGTLNIFINEEGGVSVDFWFIGAFGSEETYNDDQFHNLVAEYEAASGTVTLTVDSSDITSSADDGEDFSYSRDASGDRTRVGDETNPDAGGDWNAGGFFGRFDNLLIEAPSPPSSLVTINRDTGNVTIEPIGGNPLNFSELELSSGVGGLNPDNWTSIAGNYDSAGDGSVDANGNWQVTSDTETELAEDDGGGDGGTIAAATAVDLGDIWMRSPFEDVGGAVFDTDQGDTARSVIVYEGEPIKLGDLNLDGEVNTDDWTRFVDDYGSDLDGLSQKEAYFLADINIDGQHSGEDYIGFVEAYDAENGEGAFALQIGVVPEPSAVILLLSGLAGLAICRKKIAAKLVLVLLVGCLVFVSTADDSQAAKLAEFIFDDATDSSGNGRDGTYDAGVGGTGGISGGVLNLSGEPLEGFVIPLDDANPFDGSQNFTIEMTFNTMGAVNEDGEPAGQMLISSSDFFEPEFEDNHSMALFLSPEGEIVYDNFFVGDVVASPPVDVFDGMDHQVKVTFAAPDDLGDPLDPNPGEIFIQLDGQWLTQGEIAPNVPGIEDHDVLVGTSGNQVFPIGESTVEFAGTIDNVIIYDESFVPSLVSGVVNRTTGEVSIIGGEFAQDISFYEIQSEGGALNPGPWSNSNLDALGVDGEDGVGQSWDELDATSNRVAEGFLLGSSLVDDGRTLSLGNAYRGSSGIEDLTLTVVNSLNALFEIPLTYEGEAGDRCGDFDRDGDVDVADRTIQTVGWTGALQGGGTATFEDGDCDADGDVDTADQTGTIANWTGAMAGNLVDGDDADLIYDPATGNVTLDASDTGSGKVISFVLATDANDMNADAFAAPFIDAGTNTDRQPFQIGQTDPLNQGQGPTVDLGNILPAGIAGPGEEEVLAEYLTLAEYASDLGAGGTFDLMIVPEPSCMALAFMSLLGLAIRRRRN